MKLELAQRETYNPTFVIDQAAINMLIMRAADGFFLDFNDLTFKNSGWTSKKQVLTLSGENTFFWATGWEIPIGPRKLYQVIFQHPTISGFGWEGPLIEVLPVLKFEAVMGTLSTIEITTDLPSGINEFYKPHVIQWITGAMVDQITDVLDYDGATKKLTVTAMTTPPANGDKALLI